MAKSFFGTEEFVNGVEKEDVRFSEQGIDFRVQASTTSRVRCRLFGAVQREYVGNARKLWTVEIKLVS